MNLTDEHVRLLAKCERDMDSGAQPYVCLETDAARVAMSSQHMERFGLTQGQKISWAVFRLITLVKIEEIKQQIAYEKFLKDEGLIEPKKEVVL